MVGSPDEVFLSWPGFRNTQQIQKYIAGMVLPGDEVRMHRTTHGNCGFRHRGVRGQFLGLLSNSQEEGIGTLWNGQNDTLKVRSVYRHPVDERAIAAYPDISDEHREKGWLYTVLVSGRVGDEREDFTRGDFSQ